jgi:hypothetical protein
LPQTDRRSITGWRDNRRLLRERRRRARMWRMKEILRAKHWAFAPASPARGQIRAVQTCIETARTRWPFGVTFDVMFAAFRAGEGRWTGHGEISTMDVPY